MSVEVDNQFIDVDLFYFFGGQLFFYIFCEMIEKLRLSERNEGKCCPNFICIIESLVFFKKFFIECGGG